MSVDDSLLSILRIWAAAAWADGVVTPEEKTAMTRLIHGSGIEGEAKATALRYLDEKVELNKDAGDSLSEPARRGIYQAAVRLTRVDQEVALPEEQFLGRLRTSLAIDDATAKALEQAVDAG